MTVAALLFFILMSAGTLAWGYYQSGLAQIAEWILLFGALWLLAVWRRWRWFAYIGLVLSFLVAAFGLWFLNFPPGWMFAGAIGGLLAWDLTFFRFRLKFVGSNDERFSMERRHLIRVTYLALLGFGLASLAMAVKLEFNFDWALLLVIVAAVGFIQLVGWFRKNRW